MRKLSIVIVGLCVIAGLLSVAGTRARAQKSREGSTIVLPPGSRSTEAPSLPSWMRIGSNAAGAFRPNLTRVPTSNGASVPARPCSIGTIVGQWAWRHNSKDNTTGLDVGGVGTWTVESNGNDSIHGWFTWGDQFSVEVTATGTVTVDADCIGTQVWDGDDPQTINKLVIARDGREVWFQNLAPAGFSQTICQRIRGPL